MSLKSIIENKKILITGGAGFIGSNLCDSLVQQNNKVVCLDNFVTGKIENITHLLEKPNFTLIEGDIRNNEICQQAVQGIDIVLHQAALGSIPRSINDPITTNAINIDGFLNMIFASKEAGVKRFVYASSSSVYGDSKTLPKVEEQIGLPISPYGITKRVNELYAQNFSNIYGIETIGLRYFNVYGKRQDPLGAYAAAIPKFIKSLINKETPTINGDGSFSRDFTYINDVIQINQLAAVTNNNKAFNQIFNVAAGASNTINDMFFLIRTFLSEYDKKIALVEPHYGDLRPGDIPHSLASIEKAQSLLSYTPQFDFKKGLKKTVEWYVQNI